MRVSLISLLLATGITAALAHGGGNGNDEGKDIDWSKFRDGAFPSGLFPSGVRPPWADGTGAPGRNSDWWKEKVKEWRKEHGKDGKDGDDDDKEKGHGQDDKDKGHHGSAGASATATATASGATASATDEVSAAVESQTAGDSSEDAEISG